ncbi:MAG: protein-tyrosine phosphatase [Actinomycetota bacterium]|nr:protein-tyrosine phosphatase [Actinomycetota bacterium]
MTAAPAVSILVVCTANQCRSPLTAALLERALVARGVDAGVRSAGTRALAGGTVTTGTLDAARKFDADLSDHATTPLVRGATQEVDLVIALAREHVREIVSVDADAWRKTFTLKELVRRGTAVGPRVADEDLASWLSRVHEGRTARELMGAAAIDDVEDPTASTLIDHATMAHEVDDLVRAAVALGWPPPRRGR